MLLTLCTGKPGRQTPPPCSRPTLCIVPFASRWQGVRPSLFSRDMPSADLAPCVASSVIQVTKKGLSAHS